jgi:hypothetical protein
MTDAVVAIAQAPSVPGRLADNAEQAARLISASAEAGASIAILPELFLSGYDVRGILDNPYRHVVTEGDPICTVVQRACARHEIAAIVGGAVALTDGIANAALVIAPDGTLVHVYRKVHLWGEEAQAFVAGTQPTLVDLAGLRIGMSICFDAGFPEHVRALTLAGADLIACPAAFAVGKSGSATTCIIQPGPWRTRFTSPCPMRWENRVASRCSGTAVSSGREAIASVASGPTSASRRRVWIKARSSRPARTFLICATSPEGRDRT